MRKSFHPLVPRLLVGIVCSFLSAPGFSQSNVKPDDTNALRFDVVSIRPSSGARTPSLAITPDGYNAIGMPLETTLLIAYTPAPFFKHLDEVKGIPSWASGDKYDIQAKVAPTDVAQWRALNENIMRTSTTLQHMLQLVLTERCKLRIHSGETTTAGYALSIQHKSLQLAEDSTLPVGNQGFDLLDGAKGIISMQNGEQIYTFYNISMPVFATYLSMTSKQTVEDRTGLRGRYKFALHHISYPSSAEDSAPEADMAMPWDLRSLGMKLSKEQVMTKRWIVDNMEKPSPN